MLYTTAANDYNSLVVNKELPHLPLVLKTRGRKGKLWGTRIAFTIDTIKKVRESKK